MENLWILDLAEQDPERLLSMSEQDYRTAMAEAGFDVDELVEMFAVAVEGLIADHSSKERS